jgi:hypothetical protein
MIILKRVTDEFLKQQKQIQLLILILLLKMVAPVIPRIGCWICNEPVVFEVNQKIEFY